MRTTIHDSWRYLTTAVLSAWLISTAAAAEPGAFGLDPASLAADSTPPAATSSPAQETTATPVINTTEQQAPATQPAADAPWPTGLWMDAFDAIGIGQPMRELGLRAYGYVEAGMTFKLRGPGGRSTGLPLRGLDGRKPYNLRLNQVMLFLDRPVDTNKNFDLGGTFTFLYGTDAAFTHSLGLLDKQNHDVQPDIVQGYGEAWFKTGPNGQGFDVIFGKWLSPIRAESAAAAFTYLYSHSYLFTFAEPLANTGLKLSYHLNPTDSVYVGVVRGWDDFKDNNDGASWVGGFQLSSKELLANSPRSQFAFNTIVGPEQAGKGWPGNRVLFESNWKYRWTEKLTQLVEGVYGFQDDVPGALGHNDVPAVRDSAWYGMAYYLNYVFNDYLSTTGRAEWFTDNHGVRTGYRGTFFEATAGLGITPFPKDRCLKNLILRPELRGDWSANDAPFAHDGLMTAAFDVVYKF